MISTAFQGKEVVSNTSFMNGDETSNVTDQLEDLPKTQQVHFCTIQRLNGHVYLLLCTDLEWRIYRIDHFHGNAVDKKMAPVRIQFQEISDAHWITGVRCFRLFSMNKGKGETPEICAVFVSEKCQEVDYQKTKTRAASMGETQTSEQEELTIFSLSKQKIIKKLPPSPSFVENIRANALVFAILCSYNTILLYDIKTFELKRAITTTSTAMALGTRWIAYPGFVDETKRPRQDSETLDEMMPEAHINGKAISGSRKSSGSYSAIEVAQNVASGLYYLSELGRSTIAPYLSSSAGNANATTATGDPSGSPGTANAPKPVDPHAGWILIEDLVTGRVISNFQAHSSPLVALAFDFSGMLLVTCSVKGQKLHVYRLVPPLQTSSRAGEQVQLMDHLLLYKLQRGITHASIQDISFSQDAKWITITSAHGTSHVYAIHPEGTRDVSGETHATEDISDLLLIHKDSITSGSGGDLCADFRRLETQKINQVLKIRHTSGHGRKSSSVTTMEHALDASQAFLNSLASSTMLDMTSPEEKASRLRKKTICCSFAPDSYHFLVSDHGELKLFKLIARALPPRKDSTGSTSSSTSSSILSMSPLSRSPSLSNGYLTGYGVNGGSSAITSSNDLGLDVSATELKSWDCLNPHTAIKSCNTLEVSNAEDNDKRSSQVPKSELRTNVQRSLPLWAHPKVTFRVYDEQNPKEGKVLEVKRKGPTAAMGGRDDADFDGKFFSLEMDKYTGTGGSPVFDGKKSSLNRGTPPPLDLPQSLSSAMRSQMTLEAEQASIDDTEPQRLRFAIKDGYFDYNGSEPPAASNAKAPAPPVAGISAVEDQDEGDEEVVASTEEEKAKPSQMSGKPKKSSKKKK